MKKKFLKLIIVFFSIIIFLYSIITLIIYFYAKNIDNELKKCSMNFSSTIYYYDKNINKYKELQKLNGIQDRSWSTISEIPEHLKNAFISIEDKRFYFHNGIDYQRTLSAMFNWLLPKHNNFGGSTITQQLIKNITSENSISIKRKFFEIIKAFALEKKQNKNSILEFYLNTIYLGNNIYGVKSASKIYFGKQLYELNLAESTIISAITNNPTLYDPFTQIYNLKNRQKIILNEMLNQKLISSTEYNEALNYHIIICKNQKHIDDISQSYFIDELISNIINDFIINKGYSRQLSQFLIYSGGLKIYSTLDNNIQNILENIFENQINFPNIKGKNNEKPESSMVIMNPYNGYVVGLIGGRGKKSGDLIINRATQTKRSPGSIIKPISVYAPAIDMNIINPYSVYDDVPFYYSSKNIWPKNYYNTYNGKMSVMEALEISNNTIPVYILEQITPEKSFEYLNDKLNVSSLVKNYQNNNNKVYTDLGYAPLALGGLSIGISVLEITSAYCPFVNNGYYYTPILYTEILDSNGNLLFKNISSNKKVYQNDKTITYMNLLLKNVVDNGTARKAKLVNMDTAGKTGTTSDDIDRWFVGYTPYYVAACWFGYDNPQSIINTNNNPALYLWYNVMNNVHKKLKPQTFNIYKNLISTYYCLDSGLKPNENCYFDIRGNRIKLGYYYKQDIPYKTCTLHKNIVIDISTGYLASEFCPQEVIKNISILNFKRQLPNYVYVKDNVYNLSNKNYITLCPIHKININNINNDNDLIFDRENIEKNNI